MNSLSVNIVNLTDVNASPSIQPLSQATYKNKFKPCTVSHSSFFNASNDVLAKNRDIFAECISQHNTNPEELPPLDYFVILRVQGSGDTLCLPNDNPNFLQLTYLPLPKSPNTNLLGDISWSDFCPVVQQFYANIF